MIEILEATTDAELRGVKELLDEYTAWAFKTIPSAVSAPTFEGHVEEIEQLPGEYSRPGGCLLLARVDRVPAGCVAYRALEPGRVELKRMYVRPAFRGMKIGRRLVTTLLDEARAAGNRMVVLDSHRSMASAHRIYEAAGFTFVPVPDSFPPALRKEAVFMELRLRGQDG